MQIGAKVVVVAVFERREVVIESEWMFSGKERIQMMEGDLVMGAWQIFGYWFAIPPAFADASGSCLESLQVATKAAFSTQ